jgi:hypothetical protein
VADIQLNATQIWLYAALWGAFCATIGWFAKFGVSAYRLHVARKHVLDDAEEDRRRKFLGFLGAWAADVEANRRMVTATNVFVTVAGRFDRKRLELVREASQVELDFRGDRVIEFIDLVNKIVVMTPGSIESAAGRQELLKAIRSLTVFLKEN